jgi:predicted enzyme related to lactoylglutathione lyase
MGATEDAESRRPECADGPCFIALEVLRAASRMRPPPGVADHRNAPVNALGYLRVMFAVDEIDETLARLRKRGAQLVGSEVVQYEDAYRLCYLRGPGGLLIGLAQELG